MENNMFQPNLIDLSIDVNEELQLFDLIGSRVIESKFAKLGYISNLAKRELSYPTGLKFKNISLALPHVDSLYIEKPFIYIARTRHPLSLRQMGDSIEMDASNFLFLGIKDSKKQPELLANIMAAFQDDIFANKFLCTNNENAMYKLVKKKILGEK
ncbi:PTS sugar transporter subunit IIA [Bombilactobacillus bombi]|uniref:PTS sugar transporter subunit IIA n=1 Tax=Bombilactobacillus bombi TaxID=1303590 RepID=UPI0015E5E480|nr:PTS sugar transporter subunit IIA [Bombilactobacillus bombi]MBA1434110.1 PTS sugar transporter subunit IIA [Bombilactobacillus bombi]